MDTLTTRFCAPHQRGDDERAERRRVPVPLQMDTEEATLLLDLDADLLLFVVEASGARGQGVWKGVCKLLALLVEEVEKTTPFFASASIEGDEDFATTAMCANAATS